MGFLLDRMGSNLKSCKDDTDCRVCIAKSLSMMLSYELHDS